MASMDLAFLVVNWIPGKGQQIVDSLLAKLFPSTIAHGFQSVSSEDSPALPASLRLQFQALGDDRMILAQKILQLRFHAKLLLLFVIALLLLCTYDGLIFTFPSEIGHF